MKFTGRQVAVGFGREATRGTIVPAQYWMPWADFSFYDRVERARVESALGTLEDSEQSHNLTKRGEGDMGAEVRDRAIGFLLSSLLGDCSTADATPEAGVYTHTISLVNTVLHPTMSIYVKDSNNTLVYPGSMLSSITLTAGLDNVLMWSATFMGKKGADSSATTDYTAENKFTKQFAKFRVAGSVGELTSASNLNFKSFSLTINQNVEADDALGTAEPVDFHNRQISTEGTISLNYEDDTWKNYQQSNEYKAFRARWENTDVTIGAVSHPSLQLVMPKVDFYEWTPNYALNEIVSQNVSFKASYDLRTHTDALTITLVNTDDGTNY